ncbi:MAG: protease modulator HflC [Spirochaetaceae bacterium]|nr:protease modulator HflC [Spirochaetaceae bacterium]
MKKTWITLAIIVFIFIAFLMLGPFYIVNEGYQAVITRFGQIVNTRTEAGLYMRIPVIDVVTTYPKLILSLDGDSQRIPTKENQFIIVDTTSRWRISDPALFYQSFKTLDAAYNRLSDIIDSATRTIITQNPLAEVVRSSDIINQRNTSDPSISAEGENSAQIASLINDNAELESVGKGRRQLSNEMATEARKMLAEYGIELIDIVPRQIKYSDELTESVYNRMIKERNQVAQAYRSWGEAQKADILGSLEKEKLTIQSEAYRQSEEEKGRADAEASRIYAEAYSKDPAFYEFWKSMESYKTTMPKFDATLSTNMDYFKYLYGQD